MAAAISAYLRTIILDHLLRNQPFTPPEFVYASLHTANPGTMGANEVTGGKYERRRISWNAARANLMTNKALLDFPLMPKTTVVAIGIWDAPSGGNFMWGGDTISKTTNDGDTYQVPSSALTVSVT